MLRLLRLVHLPFWEKSPHQALLPVLGIALGVAAIVAIDLGSGSTVASFRHTLGRLEGRATHQVHPGRQPLRGEIAPRLLELDGVEAAAPILETMALAQEPLRLIGIDPLSEAGVRDLGLQSIDPADTYRISLQLMAQPGALLVSTPFLRRNGLAAGDSLDLAVGSLRRKAFVLDALPEEVEGMDVPDNLALCDLATAQELTGRTDVSRIDLVVAADAPRELLRRVQTFLPLDARIESPGGSARYLQTMLGALQMNLRALSYLALFVSLFLIYNAMLLAVLRRRSEMAVVRCLGATRSEVLGAWLVEATVIGALGTTLGLLLGVGASRFALAGISQTASDLYGYVRADAVHLVPATLVKAAVIGMVAAVAAALQPAFEAASTPPAHSASRGDVEAQSNERIRRAPWLALPLGIVAIVALLWKSNAALPGYIAAISIALAAAVVVPFLGSALLGRLRGVLAATLGEVAALSAQNIRASLSRTGVALAALTVALSMSIAMGTMVSSFREELRGWIEDTVRADVYISAATAEIDRIAARIDPEVVEILRNTEGVRAIDTYRGRPARVRGFETFAAGVDISAFRSGARPQILRGPSPEVFLDRIVSGQAGISETLSRRAGLDPGSRFTVEVDGHEEEFVVAGVYRDYSSDRGVVLLDQRTWRLVYGEQDPNSVALYLEDGVDIDDFVEALKVQLAGEWALEIRSNRALRARADEVFTRTFAVANSLEVIGIAVAAIGILAALLAMLMERGRELATLRALGLTARQLRNLLLGESILLATIAWVFALICGSGLSWILLRVINLRSFGWMLPFHLPWGDWTMNLVWSLLAAGLATVLPILRSRRLPLAQALREE